MAVGSRLMRGAVLALLVALAMLRFEGRALAISDENKVLFGPVGVAQNEGVRVNVYAISDPGVIVDPGNLPWTFTVRIFNRRGELAMERRLQLAPGVTGSVNVNITDPGIFPVDTLGRLTLRAEIVGFNPQPDPPGFYAATLEVFGLANGRTHILLGGPDTLPAIVAR